MISELTVTAIPGFAVEGKVGKIQVKAGDLIEKDAVVLSLEGGKGGLDVKSTVAGKVVEVKVAEGDTVRKGDVLVTVEEASAAVETVVKVEAIPGFNSTAKVGKISVSVGSEVAEGDVLLNLEGGKVGLDVKSPVAGKVVEILVAEGDDVAKGAEIVKLEAAAADKSDEKTEDVKTVEYHGEVVVLGGGPGGYVAAIRASQRGKKTIIIEYDNLGGTCLNRGCIPTKSMVQSTRVLDTIKEADIFGMMDADCRIDMEKIIDRKASVVSTLVGGLNASMDRHGIQVIRGKGVVRDEKSIEVALDGEKAIVTWDDLILSPGSVVAFPPVEGATLEDNLTSDELLEQREIPSSLIILGGRVIAMEFAFIYQKLGCQVTVIQRSKTIFPNMDDDVVKVVRDSAIAAGIKLYEGAAMKSIKTTADGGKLVEFERNGKTEYLAAEKLAVATGRKPNLEGLGLEKLGVEISDKYKGIKVDEHMHTTADHIWAIGDATNIYNLAHVASKQGLVAVENIMGNPVEMKYNAIPEAVFTAPEIGICGKTEKQCQKDGIDYIVGKFPYASNGKALVENATEGFVKVIARRSDRVIIGSALIGHSAADLMSAFANLITIGATIDQAKDVVYAHPTVSETLMESIMDLDGESIHK